jgi:glucose-1-phosphate cytidylyltransferase
VVAPVRSPAQARGQASTTAHPGRRRPLTGRIKTVILAGGVGTRLAEETEVRPKPMVEIGGKPILWHILMHYAHHGFHDFILALGYKGEVIKRYMVEACSLHGNLRVDLRTGTVTKNGAHADDGPTEDWSVDLVDTGLNTETGGRVKRLAPYLQDGTFMLTYGDGVSDVDLNRLLDFHRSHGKLATVTAVRPPARFGRMDIDGERVVRFAEKPQLDQGWINGGFFVFEPAVLDYIEADDIPLQSTPLERLAHEGQLMAYRHESFWQCMDTLRDKLLLQRLWEQGNAPWKVWR